MVFDYNPAFWRSSGVRNSTGRTIVSIGAETFNGHIAICTHDPLVANPYMM
jgi:hypothetical protein